MPIKQIVSIGTSEDITVTILLQLHQSVTFLKTVPYSN